MPNIPPEPIKFYADFQLDWRKCIDPLEKRRYRLESADRLSIQGDAPKGFLRLRERPPLLDPNHLQPRERVSSRLNRWPAYIAKVGSKWYPVESITEQLLTRIGQLVRLEIAESQLRVVGDQVRFLSRYFLRRGELLYHGFDLFSERLGQDLVTEIASTNEEPHFYTFQTIGEAILDRFPAQFDTIRVSLTEMIAFDALVGNNDRHPANWGVVVAATGESAPRFSPVFDTARALFWNTPESRIQSILINKAQFDKYVRETTPQIGWDKQGRVSHFELIGGICREHPEFKPSLRKFVEPDIPSKAQILLESEFRDLMSAARRRLIVRCLEERLARLQVAVGLT